ncbi:hypothetical protein BASA84_000663 [Batrachochytrium salamandrivorans]|nr:hypothetical protein BASA84_000663 [Batrachochytrium salamandrivorans]
MLLYDTLKFSCQRCQAGHRSAVCIHLDRRVEEIKAKGRPVSQCGHCRAKRQRGVGHSHHRCRCGDKPPKSLRASVEVAFASGLVLCFEPRNNDVDKVRKMVDRKEPFHITVVKKQHSSKASAASRSGNDCTTPNLLSTNNVRRLPSSINQSPSNSITSSLGGGRASKGIPSASSSAESLTAGYTDTISHSATTLEKTEDVTVAIMEPVSIKVFEVQVNDEMFSALNNPCKCHFGGVCICADLPQDKGEKSSSFQNTARMAENGSIGGASHLLPIAVTSCISSQSLDKDHRPIAYSDQNTPATSMVQQMHHSDRLISLDPSSRLHPTQEQRPQLQQHHPSSVSQNYDPLYQNGLVPLQPIHLQVHPTNSYSAAPFVSGQPLISSQPFPQGRNDHTQLPLYQQYAATHPPSMSAGPLSVMNPVSARASPHFLSNEQYQQFLQFQQFQQFQKYQYLIGTSGIPPSTQPSEGGQPVSASRHSDQQEVCHVYPQPQPHLQQQPSSYPGNENAYTTGKIQQQLKMTQLPYAASNEGTVSQIPRQNQRNLATDQRLSDVNRVPVLPTSQSPPQAQDQELLSALVSLQFGSQNPQFPRQQRSHPPLQTDLLSQQQQPLHQPQRPTLTTTQDWHTQSARHSYPNLTGMPLNRPDPYSVPTSLNGSQCTTTRNHSEQRVAIDSTASGSSCCGTKKATSAVDSSSLGITPLPRAGASCCSHSKETEPDRISSGVYLG